MELRTLGYFLAIANEGSITAAAAKLHVTQPTLSRQIKDLEAELGEALFIRHSHSMALTPEGKALRRRAREIVEMVEQARAEVASIGNESVGDVYIGGAETESMRVVARALKAFREIHPQSCAHFTSGNSEDVLTRLDGGVLDFAVIAAPTVVAKYNSLPLSRERWSLYVRADNPLSKKRLVAPADLTGEPLIVSRQLARRSNAENPLSAWFGKEFSRIRVAATFNLPHVGSMMVKEGLGSMLTWEGLVSTSPDSPIVALKLEPEMLDATMLCWRKGDTLSPAASSFLQCLKAEIAASA